MFENTSIYFISAFCLVIEINSYFHIIYYYHLLIGSLINPITYLTCIKCLLSARYFDVEGWP